MRLAFVRRRWFLISAPVALVVALLAWRLAAGSAPVDRSIVAAVKRGPFTAAVTTSGELKAAASVQITAPANAMQAQAYNMRIQTLVPEGTVVKAGDVVCELDRSTLQSRMTDVTLALQKAEAQQQQAMLDSTLTLSGAREAIRNLELGLEEKRLAKEQAVYEAPTVRRQAEIDYERATRELAQSRP